MDELTNPESKIQSPETEKTKAVATNGNGKSVPSASADGLSDAIQTVADDEDLVGEDAKLGMVAARVNQTKTKLDTTHTEKSDVSPVENIPAAPFYGSKVVEIKDLSKVFAFINETALFKGQWQYKQGKSSKEDYQKLLEREVHPKFKAIKAQATRDKLLEAKLVYGYFPCQSSGNDLIIYETDEKTERLRFTFPRQPKEQRGGKNLCLADYFASVDSGVISRSLGRVGGSTRRNVAQTHPRRTRFCRQRRNRISQTFPSGLSRLALQLRLSGVSESRRPNETF